MYIDIQYLGEAAPAALRLSLWLVAGAALKQFFGFEPVIGEMAGKLPGMDRFHGDFMGISKTNGGLIPSNGGLIPSTWKIIPLSKWLVAVFFSPIDQWDNERIGDLRSSGLLTSGMILQVGIFHEIEDLINTYGDITGMYNSVDIYIYMSIFLLGVPASGGLAPNGHQIL